MPWNQCQDDMWRLAVKRLAGRSTVDTVRMMTGIQLSESPGEMVLVIMARNIVHSNARLIHSPKLSYSTSCHGFQLLYEFLSESGSYLSSASELLTISLYRIFGAVSPRPSLRKSF